MSSSLLQPQLTSYPVPGPFEDIHTFTQVPTLGRITRITPLLRDCEAALDWLPQGSDAVPFYTLSAGAAANVLPLRHKFGECVSKLHHYGSSSLLKNDP